MPYIPVQQRIALDASIVALVTSVVAESVNSKGQIAGIMNYTITKMLTEILKHSQLGKVNYARHNEIIGMLEACKLEWYREQVAPYEDLKKKENGAV